MANPFVPGFENDVFVSYAHIDDVPPRNGWVTQLVTTFERTLKQELGGKSASVWYDARYIQGSDRYGDREDKSGKIMQAVANSAVMLSVMSKAYVGSDYCREEVKHFREQAAGSWPLQIDDMMRVEIARYSRVSDSDVGVDPALKRQNGFTLFRLDTTGVDQPFDPTPTPDSDTPFNNEIRKLAAHVAKLLQAMKLRAERTGTPGPKTTPVVFLAHVAEEPAMNELRDKVRSALSQAGALVVPPDDALASLPIDAIEALIAKCDVSVHMLGKTYGTPVIADKSRPHWEYEAAKAAGETRPRPRVVWMTAELDCDREDDARYRSFVKDLALEPNRERKVELLQNATVEGLIKSVQALLPSAQTPSIPSTAASAQPGDQDIKVLIAYAQRDRTHMEELRSRVHRCSGFDTFDECWDEMDGDRPDKNRLNLRKAKIALTDGLLLVYNGEPTWLDAVRVDIESPRKGKHKIVEKRIYDPPPPRGPPPVSPAVWKPIGPDNDDVVGFAKSLRESAGNR